ncbi:MAG: response regulator transcription factor, partial [Deltaproteobacteria bacterium]
MSAKPKILAVEDDRTFRSVLALALASEGYEVETAPDGAEALERIPSAAPPELVILDIALPNVNGAELI